MGLLKLKQAGYEIPDLIQRDLYRLVMRFLFATLCIKIPQIERT